MPTPDAAPRKVVLIWRRSSARVADFQRLAMALREAEGRTA